MGEAAIKSRCDQRDSHVTSRHSSREARADACGEDSLRLVRRQSKPECLNGLKMALDLGKLRYRPALSHLHH